ncbi:MAG: DNA-directed RNA polymerase subunit omega [Clostridiales bacterium]|nr:DNA-directed RNA polymerase subunit omega [Clostridiales bacterium]MDD7348185.1 DNA-directed RNA polymerase subunit omega [Clostridiales bacterium]MDY4060399.1 DNA-directed RNA polymerase subunit omega [Anaerovoracaceae bacterium]
MLYPSVNQIREKADSRYTLVILAAKRAKDIVNGFPILTETESNKPVTLAAAEIAEDLITYTK